MDVGGILLYCFYATLQMYILMFVGMLGVWKKIINEKKSKVFSSIVFCLIIPFFQIVQISQAGTYEILKMLWVIIVNFIVAMVVAYLITKLCHVIFRMEVRIKESFASMCTFPAVGALPLVIGNGYCFPGGPIEEDPFCKNFLGVMMMSCVVLNFALFVFGYVLLLYDRRTSETIGHKLKYIWHDVLEKHYNTHNYTIEMVFKKFFIEREQTNVEKDYEEFIKDHELPKNLVGKISKEDKAKTIQYYKDLFQFAEIKVDPLKRGDFYEFKEKALENLSKDPCEYPFCPTIHINTHQSVEIEHDYQEWESKMKEENKDFAVKFDVINIDKMLLIKACFSPPNLAFFLGLILAMSKIREIMFDGNIYFANIVDGGKMISSNLTPFLFLVIGVACLPKSPEEKALEKNRYTLLSKLHIILLFIIRFLIVPALGLLAIWIWKKIYGKECVTSPVFRLVLFFPWCLPSATTFSVLVNMSGYFFEEYGLLVMLQNFSCVILLTVLNMLYFLIIGL